MSWLVELNDSFLPIVATIVGITATGVAAIVSVHKLIKENHTSKKTTLEDIKNIKNRHEEIRKFNKFIYELEIKTIPLLKDFNWLEVEAIFKRNIGITTIKNLQILSKKQLIALDNDRICLPKRSYVLVKHFRCMKSIMLFIAFAASLIWLIYIIFNFPSMNLLYIEVLLLTLLLEVLVILNFEDFIIVNTMREDSYIEKNDICISENFKVTLEEYNKFKTDYYSISKLKELNTRIIRLID